ncbi:MAG TPA: ATPase, T2SS/T4P/T4SS family [Candidatus Eremiobacteraeota bacterium]|nr:ATPase, T2SS/T4P/T4SS family [Candidatus Eremiobacteraeota bacterium]
MLSKIIRDYKQGIIIINGLRCSGLSTTVASLLNTINQNRYAHIITLEDTPDYLYKPHKSLIRQRLLKIDFKNEKEALASATKEDVDVIFIHELNEPDLIKQALIAAEKGILVVTCMRTLDARHAIEKLLDCFSLNELLYVRSLLAENLKAIISQRLLPSIDGTYMVPITEVLIWTHKLYSLIKEGNTDKIDSLIEESDNLGMQTFDKSILKLVNEGKLSAELALNSSINRINIDKDTSEI